jgi:hypothetical protein
MRRKLSFIGLSLIVLVLLTASSCDNNNSNRTKAVDARWNTYEQAKALYPDPKTENFPLRQALVKMTQRQDMINHPWYIYTLGDNGNVIGYYVAQTVPINACDFLSSTDDVYNSDQGVLSLTAPSLDGIFYGGSGSSSGCDAWFFFDYATDAQIQIRGVNFFTADQPLMINAEAIKVSPDQTATPTPTVTP